MEPHSYLDFELAALYRCMALDDQYSDLESWVHDQVGTMLEMKLNLLSRQADPLSWIKSVIEENLVLMKDIEQKIALVSERSPQHREVEGDDFSDTVTIFRRWSFWAAPLESAYKIDQKREKLARKRVRTAEMAKRLALAPWVPLLGPQLALVKQGTDFILCPPYLSRVKARRGVGFSFGYVPPSYIPIPLWDRVFNVSNKKAVMTILNAARWSTLGGAVLAYLCWTPPLPPSPQLPYGF